MKTVLIVDDEFDLTSTLRAILEGEGRHVDTCDNGKAALEKLRGVRPDLVLMDVMMPMLSGLEVLKSMRQSAELKDVPVILMSSMAPAVKRADYQWQAFLRKPFSLSVLLKTVEKFEGEAAAAPVE